MLIPTRRVAEAEMIGDDVTTTVLGVKGNQVCIGIDSPRCVFVDCDQIYPRIKREHREAEMKDARTAGSGRSPRSKSRTVEHKSGWR
ncbi:MAG: carbon storage regulator [Steroidobacteraceae bacterium]